MLTQVFNKFAILLICCLAIGINCQETLHSSDKFAIEGKVHPPEVVTTEWLTTTRILINAGEHVGFLRQDGSFSISNVAPGSYVVEVANPNYLYEPIRVDVTSKGKLRARKVNYLQSSNVQQLQYPLRFKARAPFKYFQVRETWKVTDFLFNPMVIMMVLPLVCFMFLPKMINTADPETQRDMQQLQMPKYDMPELSELMTSMFTGSKKPSTSRAVKPAKKR
ncbi:RNF14 [Cordylochernes scorpioides]|uniref:RNF14 n=1 Tax=Cordylochernes scorpioides TaxID=51811 RepID=A0ABY6LIP7_9ARAC|nr:RNF14 [Cordylochernes scorpioides]